MPRFKGSIPAIFGLMHKLDLAKDFQVCSIANLTKHILYRNLCKVKFTSNEVIWCKTTILNCNNGPYPSKNAVPLCEIAGGNSIVAK